MSARPRTDCLIDVYRRPVVELLKRDALRTGTFTLASGRRSHYYVDGRKVTLSAAGAAAIGDAVCQVLAEFPSVVAVGGLTLGADPIVGATLAVAATWGTPHLRGFLVRKEAKLHGTGSTVEGPLEPGAAVAIVDDVATTGGSSLRAIEAVEALGCTVACVIVVLDRLEGAAEAFAARGIPFRPLTTIRDLGVEPAPPPASASDPLPYDPSRTKAAGAGCRKEPYIPPAPPAPPAAPDRSVIDNLGDRIIGLPIDEARALLATRGCTLFVVVSVDVSEGFSVRIDGPRDDARFNVATREGRVTRVLGVG